MAIAVLRLRAPTVLCSGRGAEILFTGQFPEIARACENLPLNTLINGEVIAYRPAGTAVDRPVTSQRSGDSD